MPADTVQIAGQRVNRRALYVAGAVALGVVGYAWWTRKPQVPPEVVTEGELDALGDERIPTTGVPYDPNVRPGPGGISTNAEWAQFATDRLNSLGYDPIAVGDALGKFLDRKPLTPAEANIARAAIGQAGEPPVGRPWVVMTEQPPASVGLLAPAGLNVTWLGWQGQVPMYRLTWEAVSGAADYHVIAPNGQTFVVQGTSIDDIPGTPNTPGTAKVAARNAAHVVGPYASKSWTPGPPQNQPAPPPPAGPPPAAVPTTQGGVAVKPEGGDRYSVAFNETPGATAYRLRWETSDQASGWVPASPGAYGYAGTFTWRFGEPATQFAVRVQAGNAAGFDPHGIASAPVYSA